MLVCNFMEKRLQHRCLLVYITKFLKTPIWKNIFKRLLLNLPKTSWTINFFISEKFITLTKIYFLKVASNIYSWLEAHLDAYHNSQVTDLASQETRTYLPWCWMRMALTICLFRWNWVDWVELELWA